MGKAWHPDFRRGKVLRRTAASCAFTSCALGALLVLLVVLLPFAAAAVAPTDIDRVIREFGDHGIVSPRRALVVLQEAGRRLPPRTSIAARARYHFMVGHYAALDRRQDLVVASLIELTALAESGECGSCRAQAQLVRAGVASRQKKLREARRILDGLLQAPPEDAFTLLFMHLLRSTVMEQSGQMAEAMVAGVEATRLAELLARPSDQARALNTMGLASLGRRDLRQAEALFKDAQVIAERIGDVEMQAFVAGGQGHVHSLRGEAEQQYESLMHLLAITRAEPALLFSSMVVQINLADYNYRRGHYQESIAHALKGEKLAIEYGDPVGRGMAIYNRAMSLNQLGRKQEAIALMREAIVLAEDAGDKHYIATMLISLTDFYESTGQLREALKTSERSRLLKEELMQEQRDEAVLERQEKYLSERKSREIERLLRDGARRREEALATNRRGLALGGAALLIGGAMGWGWYRRRRRTAMAKPVVAIGDDTHDPLTGALTRERCQALMTLPAAARSRDRDVQAAIGLVLLDIDHFRNLNDAYGRVAGDAVLKEIVARVTAVIRESDAVVRWGGEEFLVVLPGTSGDGLCHITGKLQHAIGDTPLIVDGVRVPFTVSAGCVAWPVIPGQHWGEAVYLAHLALYVAKTAGRNRATCLMGLSPQANLDRVRADFAIAETCGDIHLKTMSGPLPREETEPRASTRP